MIGIFLGEQNSGKTLSMTYFAYKYFKNGYEIFSNYNLSFKHTKITRELIESYVYGKKQFNKAVFLIDEIYLLMDSRSFGTKSNKIFSYFLLQTSKRNVHLLGTAQFLNTVEKRFRENLKFHAYCNRVMQINKDTYIDIEDTLRIVKDNDNLRIKINFLIRKNIEGIYTSYDVKSLFLTAKPIFKLYDTRQLLDID